MTSDEWLAAGDTTSPSHSTLTVREKLLTRRREGHPWERGLLTRPESNAGTGEQRSETPALPVRQFTDPCATPDRSRPMADWPPTGCGRSRSSAVVCHATAVAGPHRGGAGGEHPLRVLALVGPTATGKTALAIQLAQLLGGEVVNADSRQVFRHMDIGTAKPTPAERAAAPHHLLDLVEPDEPFTLADYLDRARAAIAEIAARGRLPIVVGGTGLYVRALVRGFDVPRVPPDLALRAELEALAAAGGPPALLARLSRLDPAGAGAVDPRNPQRLVRAIEVAEATSRTAMDDAGRSADDAGLFAPNHVPRDDAPRYHACLIGLTGERALLHARADRRMDAMLAAGFPDEVAALYGRGYGPDLPAFSALGYREVGEYVRGLRSLDDAAQATKWATHRFIRRQLTWFRREQDLHWLDITDGDLAARALATIEPWLALAPSQQQPTAAGEDL